MILRNMVKKHAPKLTLVTGAVVASSQSFAADYTTQIQGAATEATANQSLVVQSVIALAVISFGVIALIRWLK